MKKYEIWRTRVDIAHVSTTGLHANGSPMTPAQIEAEVIDNVSGSSCSAFSDPVEIRYEVRLVTPESEAACNCLTWVKPQWTLYTCPVCHKQWFKNAAGQWQLAH